MKKILLVLLVLFVLCAGLPALGSADVEAGKEHNVTTAPVEVPMAPGTIVTGEVSLCWTNGYAEMKIDGKPVLVPTTGFTYDPAGKIKMSRENLTVEVDVVGIKFVPAGVGDRLDLVVMYTSYLPEGKLLDGKNYTTGSFKLGEYGSCLFLSEK